MTSEKAHFYWPNEMKHDLNSMNPPIGFHVEWQERLASTNAHLKERFRSDAELPSGTLVAVREQTAGRGRQARRWLSARDTDLCFSFYLGTGAPMAQIPSLTMAAALAATDFLRASGIGAAPKWPNDVLVGEKKICGILSERVEQAGRAGVIVGIGLNVNMDREQARAIDRPATSMLIEAGAPRRLTEALDELLPHLAHWIDAWSEGGFAAFRKEWTERAGPIGKPLAVHDGDQLKRGTLAGFGDHGELLLMTGAGLETIWSGEVA